MSRHEMERAFSEVPNGSRELGNTHQHLLAIAEKVNEDIVGIMVAAPGDSRPYDRVALVVTASRIIEVTPDGTFEAWRYADMSSLAVVGGRKKLIGRDFMWLRGDIALGRGTLNWLLPTGYYEHNTPIGKAAEDACRRAQIGKL